MFERFQVGGVWVKIPSCWDRFIINGRCYMRDVDRYSRRFLRPLFSLDDALKEVQDEPN